jgi:threonine/homoserine/homoserine lactone efflux protein
MMGPVFFILIETSIRRGFRAAVAFDLGVLLSDAVYILFAKVFIAEVSLIDTTENKALFGFIGGGLFIVYGIYNFFQKISDF